MNKTRKKQIIYISTAILITLIILFLLGESWLFNKTGKHTTSCKRFDENTKLEAINSTCKDGLLSFTIRNSGLFKLDNIEVSVNGESYNIGSLNPNEKSPMNIRTTKDTLEVKLKSEKSNGNSICKFTFKEQISC